MDIQALQASLRRYAEELLQFAEQTGIALADSRGARTHVLIDWENVQPDGDEVRALVPEATDLWLFHGPNQKHVAAQHPGFAERATPIRIARTGKNALDFHLSFYIGYIASRQPEARFVVISNDKGYEPMLEHAVELGFAAARIGFTRKKRPRAPAKRVAAKKVAVVSRAVTAKKEVVAKKVAAKKAAGGQPPPATKPPTAQKATRRRPAAASPSARKSFEQMLDMLQKRPAARLPRKPQSLLADIAQMIGSEAESQEVAAMFERLIASGRIFVEGGRAVRYAL